jgi:uncharacterized protein (DUF1778 family)
MKTKETLTTRIGCLLTTDHYETILQAAQDQGMSLSTFIRVACLEKARAAK